MKYRRKNARSTAALLIAAASLLTGCGTPEDTHPGQPVTQRRKAFKEMLRAFEPMGVMLRAGQYDAQKFRAQATRFHALRDTPWAHFVADSQYPPSHARDEVWSKPDEFAAAQRTFLAAADGLLALPENADKETAAKAYQAVAQNCHDCHQTFKSR